MPTFDVNTLLQGLNATIDYQRQQKAQAEKNAKIKSYMDMAKSSGADMTIDFDDEGNPKPKISYKHKSQADQMLEMLKVGSQVNKVKKEQKQEEISNLSDISAGIEKPTPQQIAPILPPRLRERAILPIKANVPYLTASKSPIAMRLQQYSKQGLTPTSEGKLVKLPVGEMSNQALEILYSKLPKMSAKPSPDETENYLTTLGKIEPETEQVVRSLLNYDVGTQELGGIIKGRYHAIALARQASGGTWSMPKYYARKSYLDSLSKGKLHDNIVSLNTLAEHLDELNTSIEQFQAQKLPIAQLILEKARQWSGDYSITDLKQAKEIVNTEIERALTGVGVTQMGMQERRKISGTMGYSQLKQLVKTNSQIMSKRLKTLEDDYRQRMEKDPEDKIIFPDQRQLINNLSNMNVSQHGSGTSNNSLTSLKQKYGLR